MSSAEQRFEVAELIRRFMGTWIEGNVSGHSGDRVEVDLGGGVKTGFLPVVQIRAGKMKIETKPSIGEQVVVFFPNGDEAQGRVLGALFGGSNQAEGCAHDELVITGRRVQITGQLDITGDVNVQGAVTVQGDVVADGVSLKTHTHTGDSGGKTSPPN